MAEWVRVDRAFAGNGAVFLVSSRELLRDREFVALLRDETPQGAARLQLALESLIVKNRPELFGVQVLYFNSGWPGQHFCFRVTAYHPNLPPLECGATPVELHIEPAPRMADDEDPNVPYFTT